MIFLLKQKRFNIFKIVKVVLLSVFIILLILFGLFFVYVSNYSHTKEETISAIEDTDVVINKYDGGIALGDPQSEIGFIFYPGGKVEYTAYSTLLLELAKQDIFCVIVKMPFNLAVFQSEAAKQVIEEYPEIKQWYIGGHSLGGAMAAAYAAKHPDQLEGLILLAAYATSSLKDTDLRVLSLYGSEDKVLNMENFQKGKELMPTEYSEICIEGGNHAQFGDYGLQKGDGNAYIEASEQRNIAADAIIEFINQ